MALSIVIPDSADVRELIDAVNRLVAVEEQRLQLEKQIFKTLTPQAGPAVSIRFSARIEGDALQEGIQMLQLTSVQKCDLSIQPVDAKGNPALVDGAPSWSVSDPTVLAITPGADGMTASISSVGPVGNSQVNVSADADLGEGVTNISGVLDVTVTAAEATSLGITAGTPVAQ